ncbi:hypothetical protein [Streptomyces sp. ZAF1911]|uniref:hypothetical protein n=1 Tax=Streptomyces sp. ZAF1911 TaxID=2944129 RepID=UPI0030B7FAA4
MTVRKKAIVASVSVTATISTARTADVRTGSGMRLRPAGWSTHRTRPRCPPGPAPSALLAPVPPAPLSSYLFAMVGSLPSSRPLMPAPNR